MKNTSQDPEYEGLPYKEKKFHKTHFGIIRSIGKKKPIDQDPNWIRVAPGRYRWVGKKENKNDKSS